MTDEMRQRITRAFNIGMQQCYGRHIEMAGDPVLEAMLKGCEAESTFVSEAVYFEELAEVITKAAAELRRTQQKAAIIG